MKIGPIVEQLRGVDGIDVLLVHTGQHYDNNMSGSFFRDLGIPSPDMNLGVGSGSHAVQTADVMKGFESICIEHKPDWVVVVGDVNSTLAAALVAAKLGVRIAHVEAGLRSFDRSMPEEINRVLTDAMSDLLFVTEASGVENLRREGVADQRVHLVGNVMVDSLLRARSRAGQSDVLDQLGLSKGEYALVTLHRPSNVDDADTLSGIMRGLSEISAELPVIFPAHPRTRKHLQTMDPVAQSGGNTDLRLVEPLGYLEFTRLMADAAVVLTDSGGIQEETTVLGVPCLTLRANTERPITITQGTNRLVGSSCDAIVSAFREVRQNPPSHASVPDLWDGKAAERIAKQLLAAC